MKLIEFKDSKTTPTWTIELTLNEFEQLQASAVKVQSYALPAVKKFAKDILSLPSSVKIYEG